ncbi:CocE/NonD family hydrolase [Sphingobium boeckii]|uniref:CocE/NonD family hydrolase n=1 Tax=Sphingobium boeckii TaxID=1082345 RepID=UPI0031B63240
MIKGSRSRRLSLFSLALAGTSFGHAAAQTSPATANVASAKAAAIPDSQRITLRWGERIPLQDGVTLNATLYRPKGQTAPLPCLLTLTPYTAQNYHSTAVYFAANGFPFLVVDVRGRGGSGGELRLFEQEADDSAEVVEWLASQPYCNGKVAMWGGSYQGYNQWAAASRKPPHLATIIPAASPFMGVDVPGRSNIRTTAILPMAIYIAGRTLQGEIVTDGALWAGLLRDRFVAGMPFATLNSAVGDPTHLSPHLGIWAQHPAIDAYWDAQVPTKEQFAAITIPTLSLTGLFDNLQLGAIEYFKRHKLYSSPDAPDRDYLVIGPWDHAGTRTPRPQVGGMAIAPAGVLDLQKLNLDWYRWTLGDGERPAFLQKKIAYYVTGAEAWRYADDLAEIRVETRSYRLGATVNPDRLSAPGTLAVGGSARALPGGADHYVYDPADVSLADLESRTDPTSLIDDRLIRARDGKQLVYQTAPFERETVVSGFIKLSLWIAIDQPDTDFQASIHEVKADGSTVLLAADQKRARFRYSNRRSVLIQTDKPLRYEFDQFPFVARAIAEGSRLRMVIGPINSIYSEKNYNSGGDIGRETFADSRPVIVRIVHDAAHPSTLVVPIGRPFR